MGERGSEPEVDPERSGPEAPVHAGPGVAATRAPGKAASAPRPETVNLDRGPTYDVKLPTFEGPLDLLLHLIQKHELDILDIPIGFVTEKYVEYILMMEQLNIDIASEYLVMAATLAHVKSRMLLPTPPEDPDAGVEEEEDPRAELVRRLLEYQKYRLAAEQLGERAVLGRDVFSGGTSETIEEGPAPLAQMGLFKLLDAFEAVLKRVSRVKEHQIDFERISITERISELSDVLRARPMVDFDDLFAGARTRSDVIITFLALLEMTRLKLTRISQETPYSMIRIELAVQDDAEEEPSPASSPDP